MLALDYKKGVATKNPTNQGVVCHPLLERRTRVKRRERPDVIIKTPPFLHCFLGLKNGQEVVPPFWAPKCHIYTSAKKTYF